MNNLIILSIFIIILLYTILNNKNITEGFRSRFHRNIRGRCKLCPDLPDMTKYILKAEVPACPKCPDLKNYVLKTEIEKQEYLSDKFIKKSSIPPHQCPPCPPCKCPECECPTLDQIQDSIKHNIKTLENNKNRHRHRNRNRNRNKHCKHQFGISYSRYGLLSDLNGQNKSSLGYKYLNHENRRNRH